MSSIALRYCVPLQALRRANNLYADHLLAARRTIVVPGEYYKGGVSLSPTPLEGEEEELRKAKVRRWMVATKVAEYVFIYLLSHLILEMLCHLVVLVVGRALFHMQMFNPLS